MSTGAIIGIVIGAIAGGIVLLFVLLVIIGLMVGDGTSSSSEPSAAADAAAGGPTVRFGAISGRVTTCTNDVTGAAPAPPEQYDVIVVEWSSQATAPQSVLVKVKDRSGAYFTWMRSIPPGSSVSTLKSTEASGGTTKGVADPAHDFACGTPNVLSVSGLG